MVFLHNVHDFASEEARLSIADELAKMMNGKVGCKDTDGGGATFFVTLPLK